MDNHIEDAVENSLRPCSNRIRSDKRWFIKWPIMTSTRSLKETLLKNNLKELPYSNSVFSLLMITRFNLVNYLWIMFYREELDFLNRGQKTVIFIPDISRRNFDPLFPENKNLIKMITLWRSPKLIIHVPGIRREVMSN